LLRNQLHLKHGDTFLTKDGLKLTFDSCECSIDSEDVKAF
jgi:hypothetical protein